MTISLRKRPGHKLSRLWYLNFINIHSGILIYTMFLETNQEPPGPEGARPIVAEQKI